MKKTAMFFLFFLWAGFACAQELTLDAAVKSGLANNSKIKQSLNDFRAAGAGVEKASGQYDAKFDAGVTYTDSKDAVVSAFAPEQTQVLVYNAGLSNRIFFTGGFLGLNYSMARTNLIYPDMSGMFGPIPIDPAMFTGLSLSYKPELKLSYTQPVLNGFWNRPDEKAVRMADYGKKIAQESFRSTVISEVGAINEAYALAYMTFSVVEIQNGFLKDAEELYKETVRLQATGLREKTDALQVKASMLEARGAVPQALDGYNFARENFLNLAGVPYESWKDTEIKPVEISPPAEAVQPLTVDLLELLTDMQPPVAIAKFSLEIARMSKEIAEASVLPTLDLFGTYGITGLDGSLQGANDELKTGNYKNYTVGANLSFFLPDRGAWGEKETKAQETAKAEEGYNAAKNQFRMIIKNSYNSLATAKQDYELKSEARSLLKDRMRIQQSNFSQGRISTRELVMTQAEYNTSQLKAVNAYFAYIKALNEWNKITGKYDGYYNDLTAQLK